MKRGRRLGALAACTMLLLAGLVLAWPLLGSSPRLGAAAGLGPARCLAADRPGAPGASDDLRTPQGLAISVRTPTNYDARRAQPLLVVFPPAGFGRSAAERYYGLTEAATRQGWIVAYPAAVPLSRRALTLHRTVASTVIRHWCIDPQRVAYLGHSDGATIAEGLLLRARDLEPYPSHVLASAAGLRGRDFDAETCPRPLELTLVHSRRDEHFPGYGRQAAQWWAACFACPGRLPSAEQMPADDCADLGPCAAGGRVRYCEADEAHATWPRAAADPFRFLGAPTATQTTASTTPWRS
jgi:polyhydroxybutyrate depolymerase